MESWNKWHKQCDQIGQFLKVLGNKFSYKSSPIIWWLLGAFRKTLGLSKNWCGIFWVTFGNIWTTFCSNIWSHWTQMTSQHCLSLSKTSHLIGHNINDFYDKFLKRRSEGMGFWRKTNRPFRPIWTSNEISSVTRCCSKKLPKFFQKLPKK